MKRYSIIYHLFAISAVCFCGAMTDIPDFGAAQTVITSDQLEMETREDGNHFFFKGQVRIAGNNLEATCDSMEVVTRRAVEDEGASPVEGKFGAIDRIVAIGGVMIRQTGRSATADRAEIYPDKEYVELIGSVELENEHGIVTGPRFILEKGKRARMLSDGGSERPTVTLPGLPDLGISKEDLLKSSSGDSSRNQEGDSDERSSGKR